MDLSSEEVFEFLDLLEKETLLWNPKHPLYRNRKEIRESWRRIQDSFSVNCSLDELKKKRDSLMATYRPLLRKIKASTKPGCGADEIYKPTWFAYERMARFLAPVYEGRSVNNIEESGEEITASQITEENGLLQEENDLSGTNVIAVYSSDSDQEATSQLSKSSPSRVPRKRKHLIQMNESWLEDPSKVLKTVPERRSMTKEGDFCDLYGELLIKKLKEFDEVTRVILMHDIDNLLFRAKMKQLKCQLILAPFHPLSESV